jgi:hypothetical protein
LQAIKPQPMITWAHGSCLTEYFKKLTLMPSWQLRFWARRYRSPDAPAAIRFACPLNQPENTSVFPS